MKLVTTIVRAIIGLLLLFASVTYFIPIMEEPPAPTGDMATVFAGFMATKYLMPLAKVAELLVGLSYVSGKFMKLFNLVLLPISVNILLLNIFPSQEALPIALFLFFGNVLFIYKDWDAYRGLFKA